MVVVSGADGPFWPAGFDPWNVTPLNGGEILHSHFVKLKGNSGTVEILDRPAVTVPAGVHPLFNGVKELIVTGLVDRPEVGAQGDSIVVHAPGVTATLRRGRIVEGEHRVEVRVE